jgi:hypothetical protein
MYPRHELMKTLQDERLRAAAREHRAAQARRADTARRDLGLPLGAILLFSQGIIPAVLKLAHAWGRKSGRKVQAGKGGGRSSKPAPARMGAGKT